MAVGESGWAWSGHLSWALVTVQFIVSLKGTLGCAQSDSLPPPRAEMLDPCINQGHRSEDHGLQASAGLWML